MNKSLLTRLRLVGSLALAAVLLSACQTLEYRQVQNDFNQSVQADNSGVPFTGQHAQVLASLTPDYIKGLDPTLRPNAWMLRAISAWRVGSNSVADESVRLGLREPTLVAGSRDQVVLEMVPALVIDSDLQRRWLDAGQKLAAPEYRETFETGFIAAWRRLSDSAGRSITPATSDDVVAYFHYQRWRLILNWTAVIGTVEPDTDARDARNRAMSVLGVPAGPTASPLDAAKQEAARIPPANPLRALIRAQGGG